MAKHNSFPEESRFIFQDAWMCWYCGENTADSLHHIVGRGNGDSTCESSILNAAPFCNQKCHLQNHGKISTDEYKLKLLEQTLLYLISTRYTLNKVDIEFIKKYHQYYEQTKKERSKNDCNL